MKQALVKSLALLGYGLGALQAWAANGPTLISGGNTHMHVIKDSSLVSAGTGSSGQLGLGSTTSYTTFQSVAGAWQHVSAAEGYTLAIKTDGTLWTWGNQGQGGLGLGATTQVTSPTQVGSSTWMTVTNSRLGTSLGIRSDSTLWAWGRDWYGQHGDGSANDETVPTQIGSAKWLSVTTNENHTVAIAANGTLWTWGNNGNGQLGTGTTTSRSTPGQVGSSTWLGAWAGLGYTMAIRSDSTLWVWGGNSSGQLGLGHTTNQTSPQQLGSDKWRKVAVSNGTYFHSALRADSTLWVAGINTYGQLGLGHTTSPITSHTQVGSGKWRDIGSGSLFVGGVDASGNVHAWGRNSAGNLGDGTTTNRTSPLQVLPMTQTITFAALSNRYLNDGSFSLSATASSGLTVSYTSSNPSVATIAGTTVTLVGVGTTTITASQGGSGTYAAADTVQRTLTVNAALNIPIMLTRISSGSGITFVIREDGNLYATGNNYSRQLPLGHSNQAPIYRPATTLNSWLHVAATENGGMAIKSDNTLWGWGEGGQYVLGNGSTSNLDSMTRLGNDHWLYVTSGKINRQSLGIKSDSTLWAWGANSNGQLGDGTTTARQTPVQIGSDKWVQVSSAYTHTLAIRKDGTLWAWGDNGNGNFANGTTTSSNVPVQGGGNDRWQQVIAADRYSLGIKADSTLWAWGDGWCAGTGLGVTTQYSTPQQVGSAKWLKVVSPLHQVTIALRADSTLWSWGSFGGANQLGLGSASNARVLSPTQIGSDKWRDVGGGRDAFVGLKASGQYWAWGSSSLGTNNNPSSSNVPVQISIPGQTSQTITFNAMSDKAVGDSDFVPGATASSGLAVTYASSDTTVAKIVAGKIRLVGEGTVTITASQAGDEANFAATDVSRSLNVDAAPIPLPASGIPDFPTRISSGSNSTFIITSNGNLYGTGSGAERMTGNSSSNAIYRVSRITGPWRHVAATDNGGMAIRGDSTLWGWGSGSGYVFGNGSTSNLDSMTQLNSDRWLYITTGKINQQTLGIKSDSTLWAWGQNWDGQLGNGTSSQQMTPVQVGSAKWAQVSSAYTHTLAIRNDGTLWGWGNNGDGNIGNGTNTQSLVPVQAGNQRWLQVTAADRYSLGIRADSTLWGWGDDWCGGLGLGSSTRYNKPTRIGNHKWIKIVTPLHQVTIAMRSDSTLWSWGSFGGASQLGLGSPLSNARVNAPTQIGTAKWRDVGGGRTAFAALDLEGNYWAWGGGQLGTNNNPYSSNVPVRMDVPGRLSQTISWWDNVSQQYSATGIRLTATATSNLAVTYTSSDTTVVRISQDTLYMVGAGSATLTANQAGDATYSAAPAVTKTANVTATTQTITFNTLSEKSVGDADFDPGATASSGLAVSYTSSDTMVAKVVAGKLRLVAEGTTTITARQAGNGGVSAADSVQRVLYVSAGPIPLPAGGVPDRPTRISSGSSSAYIIGADGHLYATGHAAQGLYPQAGQSGQTLNSSVYHRAKIAGPWRHIAYGDNAGFAIRGDGTLWGWGAGWGHVFGNGSTSDLDSMTQLGNDQWLYVTTGKINQQTLGIKSDSTLWAWGANSNGQLGDGTNAERSAPVQIGSDKWAQVSSAYTHTLAIRNDGTLWAWGDNGDGNFANGTTTSSQAPVQAGNQRWLQVSAADRYSVGIRADSTLWGWGDDWCGGLGLGSSAHYYRPTRIGNHKWIKIVNPLHQVTVAMRADSTLWSWGSFGGSSQLGLGSPLSEARVNAPTQIGTVKWRDVGGGRGVFAAVDLDGHYWAWGSGALGRNNDPHSSNVPVRIAVPWVDTTAPTDSTPTTPAPQTLTFADLPNRTFGDSAVLLTASASSGLPITYTSSNTAVAALEGNRLVIVGAGSTEITASQAGNASHASANKTVILTVAKASQSLAFDSIPDKTLGQADFALGAISTSGLPITYTSSDTTVVQIAGQLARIRGIGNTEITATQPGNTNYHAATSVTRSLRIMDSATTGPVIPDVPAKHLISELYPQGVTVDTSVTLAWPTKTTASHYRLQIKVFTASSIANPTDSMPLLNLDTVVTDTTFALSRLPFSARVEWRLASRNSGGTSEFSEYAVLNVRPEPPQPIEVARIPELPATGVGTSIDIVLPKAENSTGYHVQVTTDTAKPPMLDTVVSEPRVSLSDLKPGQEYNWRVAPVNGPSTAPFTPWLSFKVKDKDDGSITRSAVVDSSRKDEVKLSGILGVTPKDTSLANVQITIEEQKTAPSRMAAGFMPLTGRIDFSASAGSAQIQDEQLTLTLTPPDTSLDGTPTKPEDWPMVYLIDSVTGELEAIYDLPRDAEGRIVLPLSKGKGFILAVDTVPPVIRDSTPPKLHEPGTAPVISGVVEDNIKNSRGWMKFRRGGETHFDSALVFIDSTGRFDAPLALQLDSVGFEYHLVATDGRNRRATPRTDLSVKVNALKAHDSLPIMQWRLFALPSLPEETRWGDLTAQLGKYGWDWKLFERSASGLREFGPDLQRATVGTAYWLKTRSKRFLPVLTGGVATPVSKPFEVILPPGSWRSFGNPYLFPVSWQSVLDSSQAAPGALVGPYTYVDTSWIAPLQTPVLEAWQGYYAHNASSDTVRLRIPSLKAQDATPPLAKAAFHVQWVVRSAEGKEAGHYFGALPASSVGAGISGQGGLSKTTAVVGEASRGLWHAPKPESPEAALRVGFASSEIHQGEALFQTDFRSLDQAQGATWNARIEGLKAGQRYSNRLLGLNALPHGMHIALADPVTGAFLIGADAEHYVVEPLDGETSREWLYFAGSEEYIAARGGEFAAAFPSALSLRHYPNPVREFAWVRFAIPGSKNGSLPKVTLTLFDMRGRTVMEFAAGKLAAGEHTLKWNARDAAGKRVPTGIYRLRLQVGDKVLNRAVQVMR